MHCQFRLLGSFELRVGDPGNPVPTRTYARLYALLALSGKQGTHRRFVCNSLWPDAPASVAANRLRVALTSIRKLLGQAFWEENDRLGLDFDHAKVDVIEVADTLESLRDEIDETVEMSAIESVLSVLAQPLLPGLDDDWLTVHRESWSTKAVSALCRLSAIAAVRSQYKLVVDAALATFPHDPYHEGQWHAYLQAMTQLGDRSRAIEEFAQARKTYREAFGGDFSDEMLEMAASLRAGPFSSAPRDRDLPGARASELFARLVSVAIENAPGLVRSLFGLTETYYDAVSAVDVSVPLLERLLAEPAERDLGWQQCAINLMAMQMNVGNMEEVARLNAELMTVVEDPFLRARVLGYRGLLLGYWGELSAAEAVMDEARVIYVELGLAEMEHGLMFNKGVYALERHEALEAIEWHQRSIKFFEGSGLSSAEIRIAENCQGIGRAYLYLDDAAKAWESLDRSYSLLTQRGYEPAYASNYPIAGFACYYATKDPIGLDILIRGIKIGYRRGHSPALAAALFYVGWVLRLVGDGAAANNLAEFTLNWGTNSSPKPGSVGEVFWSRVRQGETHPWTVPFSQDAAIADVLRWAVVRLRAIASGG